MNPDLSWVLNDLLQVPGARHAILVSADGLLLANSSEIGRDDAETVAAAMSSMQSLSRAVAPFIGTREPGRWRQTLLEYEDGWIFLIAHAAPAPTSPPPPPPTWTWRRCPSGCSSRSPHWGRR